MENNATLNGFEAVFDVFNNTGADNDFGASETMTDEEIEALKNKDNKVVDKEEDDDDEVKKEDKLNEDDEDEVVEEKPVKTKTTKPAKVEKQDTTEEEVTEEDESEHIVSFFDALSEKIGWDEIDEEDKPKTAEELIQYFANVIEENSKPDYASEEVEKLDAFVRQGGDIRAYFEIEKEIDLDDLDLEDENTQRAVVKQLLKEKGFNSKQIEKKLSKYEDAGILEDEATDAIEDLKEIQEQKKQQLLKNQEKAFREKQEQQRQLYNNVVSEIKGLETIRGIKVPEKDKRALIDYILKPDTDGQTKYYKDYIKGGVKSLIESAYFTMNADKLISAAESKGRTKAVDKFKSSLRSTSVTAKSSRMQNFNDDDNSIWSSVTRSLRMS